MNELHTQIEKWLKNRTLEKRGLFIYGNTGVGKTHNLKILYQLNKEKKGDATFYTVPEFLNKIAMLRMEMGHDRHQFGRNTEIVKKMLGGQNTLILDDIGTETLSERKLEDLYTVINNMYENNKTLILSSNLSLQELERKVGDRICSRIMGMCHLLELTGDDKRFTQ